MCICRVTQTAYPLHNQYYYSVFIVSFGLLHGISGKNLIINNNNINRHAVQARAEFELVIVVLRLVSTTLALFLFPGPYIRHQRIAFPKALKKKEIPQFTILHQAIYP